MKEQEIIDYIIDRINAGEEELQIERYLKIKDVNPEELTRLFEVANERLLSEKMKTLPKKNKNVFLVLIGLTILQFILFLFVLPRLNLSQIFILSLVGSVGIGLTGIYAFLYYKSWEKEAIIKRDRPSADISAIFALLPIPCVILYFVISWAFNSQADAILKDTQKEAIATVIDGRSIKGRRYSSAEVTVKFMIDGGHEVITTEDISTYQFKDFYKGQTLRIVYSATNPENIDLLIDQESIRELKGTEERKVEPQDLIDLLNNHKNIEDRLSKLSIGWLQDQSGVWVNERTGEIIQSTTETVALITRNKENNHLYPKKVLAMDFVLKSKQDPSDVFNFGEKIFENAQYRITIKGIKEGSLIVVSRI